MQGIIDFIESISGFIQMIVKGTIQFFAVLGQFMTLCVKAVQVTASAFVFLPPQYVAVFSALVAFSLLIMIIRLVRG